MISPSIFDKSLVCWDNIWIRPVRGERTKPIYWLTWAGVKEKADIPASAIIMPKTLSLQCASQTVRVLLLSLKSLQNQSPILWKLNLLLYAELCEMCRYMGRGTNSIRWSFKDKHKMIKMTIFNLEILTKPVTCLFSEMPPVLMYVLTCFVLTNYQKAHNLRKISKK